jgi:hypothetical protein
LFFEVSKDSTVSQKSESSPSPRTQNFAPELFSTKTSKESPKLSESRLNIIQSE